MAAGFPMMTMPSNFMECPHNPVNGVLGRLHTELFRASVCRLISVGLRAKTKGVCAMRVIEAECDVFLSKIIYVSGCSFKELTAYLDKTWGKGIVLNWEACIGGTAQLQQVNKETAPLFLVWT